MAVSRSAWRGAGQTHSSGLKALRRWPRSAAAAAGDAPLTPALSETS